MLEGLAGTRSRTATARCPASRAPPASSRATPTTPRCAAPAWPARSGTTRRSPTALEREAAELKRRFNRDFWVADGEYFALAIDGDGRQVDSLTSNIGHLLWSGIVDTDKAKARRAAPDWATALFSGWGVRTMADGEARLQPDRLPRRHRLAARQLVHRAGAAAVRVQGGGRADRGRASWRRPQFFDGRLPEAFAGYPRTMTKYPVEYPTACSPQAWSTGAPLLLLRAMLGLEPLGDHLLVDPALPATIGRIELLDIPGRWGRVDAFGRGRVEIGKRRRRRS